MSALANRVCESSDSAWKSLASDRIEGEMAFVQKLVSADLGAFFEGIVQ